MLENIFTNVFGRSKSKSSGRNSQHEPTSSGHQANPGASQMTGPFSTSAPQMPQPPNLPYPVAPYPGSLNHPQPTANYYPSLEPYNKPPSMPGAYGSGSTANSAQPHSYGTLASQFSPLDSVPFEAKLNLTNSTNLVSLDQLFQEIKQAAEVVDRADAYLKSSQSDYDFKTEQGLICQ